MFANTTLMLRPVTVFAPTNMAFQEFPRSERDESLVLYHISKCRRKSNFFAKKRLRYCMKISTFEKLLFDHPCRLSIFSSEPADEAGGADPAHRVLSDGGQPAVMDHAPSRPHAQRGGHLHQQRAHRQARLGLQRQERQGADPGGRQRLPESAPVRGRRGGGWRRCCRGWGGLGGWRGRVA